MPTTAPQAGHAATLSLLYHKQTTAFFLSPIRIGYTTILPSLPWVGLRHVLGFCLLLVGTVV